MTQIPTVLVVYPHLPHYRYGVFKALAELPDLRTHFVADEIERTGTIETIPFESLPAIRVKNRWLGGVLWQSGLWRVLRKEHPDAVIFLGDVKYASNWFAAIWLRALRRPVLFWTIGWHRPERGLKKFTRLLYYRLAHELLLYGEVGRQLGSEHGFPAHRMTRVGNSRTSSKSSLPPSTKEQKLLDNALKDTSQHVVSTIVRLNASKRIDLLIEAAAIIQSAGTPVTLLIAGDGPERVSLEQRATSLNVDARFLGAVYSEDSLERIYAASQVTVLPSAAGLTVIQSMEFGTPVVTHDDPYEQMPEAEAIREGITGSLYKKGDVTSLADAIQNWFDVQSSSEASEACRAEVSARWSPASQARTIADSTIALLGGRR